MTITNRHRTLGFLGRSAVVILFLAGIILSGRFADFWDGAAIVFVIGGTIALTLLGFTFSQIGTAVRTLAGQPLREEDSFIMFRFWEALARNFWILGVLGSVIFLVLNLVQGQGGIQDLTFRLASSFQPAVYGLILGLFFGLPALKLGLATSSSESSGQPERSGQSQSQKAAFLRIETAVGFFLIIAVLFGTIFFRLQLNPTRNFPAMKFFLDWMAVLVVVGGTVVGTMLIGRGAWGAAISLTSALTGFVGAIVGFVNVLLAVSQRSISYLASSIALIISSCFLALLIMILVGIPLSDWERRSSPRVAPVLLLRLSWYVFPFFVLIFLVLAFILVITPFQKPA